MSLRLVRILLLALLAAEVGLVFLGPQAGQHLQNIREAEALHKRPDWWDDAALGIHYAAVINAALVALLLATSGWWGRASGHWSSLASQEPRHASPQWFWPMILLAVLLCLCLRLPLASKSLWWDEAWVIQQVSHGKWKADPKKPDGVKFQAHDWSRCLWYYQKPTNHVPMSVLQKASITVWQKLTKARRDQFSDLAARVPSLLASCAAVLLMACLLRAWGQSGVGVAAAFVLAVHPWYVRYGVDARAYALVVPLCISGMFAASRILESRGQKVWPWVWWGLTEWIWIWVYPNALVDVAVMNALLAVGLWRGWGTEATPANGESAFRRLTPWLITNVFAAMALIQVFLPNLMQARHWAGQEADKHVLDAGLMFSTISQVMTGKDESLAGAGFLGLSLASWCAIVLVIQMLLFAWSRKDELFKKHQWWLLASPVLAAMALGGLSRLAQSYFYPRFVIAVLPVAVVFLCLYFPFRNGKRSGVKMAFSLGIWCVLLGAPVMSQLLLLVECPYAPLHDVARYVQSQPVAASSGKQPLIACYGLGREVMPVYEPHCLPLEKKSEVEGILAKAKAEQRELYVIYGYNDFNRALLGDGFQMLDDRKLFDEMAGFPGIEPEFYFRVLKAK